jgi:protocatechuate 3,4-dioxygenase beta subunit
MSHHDHDHEHGELHDHDKGLSHDLPILLSRRRALTVLGGAGLFALAACGDDSTPGGTSTTASASSSASSSTASGDSTSSSEEIPEETGGPYPADGTNGPNVLTESGVVRSDITKSFGSASGVATGVPLTVKLKILDVSNGGGALAGAAVYLWHCTADGNYSIYSDSVTDENFLRGVQEADADGNITFTTIYPGAYAGRWPHIHFEVYPSLAAATSASDRLRTSQLALPEAESKLVYATDGYGQSTSNLAQTSLDSDNVFSDGYSLQLAKVTGSVSDGMTATLNVPV